ncbi:MAG TPA: glycosyltransferase family 2 protein [Candidatus Onthocola gallistercoris]|uniref:Glycosyltransferase family 2 protein n=1 Tax=Candidatus Onthocola gallistercoris TaxID=2840876 RepID=A0A9D1HG07_9FIRM|nr:glycosyltransferase family 2 protein [Candidatus Onthocola gallistercoris]
MENFIDYFNWTIFVLFVVFYAYQAFYIIVALSKKSIKHKAEKEHKYAAVIAARNESAVIKYLIDSIRAQDYPKDKLSVFVVADNCTDDTAQVARDAGAIVYERFDNKLVGKGYALDYIFRKIEEDHGDEGIEAYMVFDADNLLAPGFIRAMNDEYDAGYKVLTSYRNSKNYGSNWISAGYSLWYLRESVYLNNSRMILGTSCAISGTGFLVDAELIRNQGGWIHHLLTEDIEFSTDCILHDIKIGYCADAMVYDEQPITFEQSWKQRLRWSKGFYQVFGHYSLGLIKNIFKKKRFACYDMLMTLTPAVFVTLGSLLFNGIIALYALYDFQSMKHILPIALQAIGAALMNGYLTLFIVGALTTFTEWKKFSCPAIKKILYMFTFPIFIYTYVPISIVALFKKVHWAPIKHQVACSVDEVCRENA